MDKPAVVDSFPPDPSRGNFAWQHAGRIAKLMLLRIVLAVRNDSGAAHG